MRRIIESSYGRGKQVLSENWEKVERMVAALLEYETVEAEEVRAILAGVTYDRGADKASPPTPPSPPEKVAEGPSRPDQPRLKPKISPEPA